MGRKRTRKNIKRRSRRVQRGGVLEKHLKNFDEESALFFLKELVPSWEKDSTL